MRKQIAAANWKMNLTIQQAEALLREVLTDVIPLDPHHQVIFAVPFPYLAMANNAVADKEYFSVAAQCLLI
jgi:triosephosphate isomerase